MGALNRSMTTDALQNSRISRTGNVYRVSPRRLLRHVLVSAYGRRRREKKPRPWGGHYRWMSRTDWLLVWRLRSRGWSNNQISQRLSRDRRSIDRRLTDQAAVEVALALAVDDVGWVHVPVVVAGIRDAEVGAALAPTLTELLLRHRDDWRRWCPMWRRWQALTLARYAIASDAAPAQP